MPELPEGAVEAAAAVLGTPDVWRDVAVKALEAAAPAIRKQERERLLKALRGKEMKQIAADALFAGTPNNQERSGKFGEAAITSNRGSAETGAERVMEATGGRMLLDALRDSDA